MIFCNVVVAPALKATLTPARKMLNHAVEDAELVNVVVADVLIISRLLNADVPVIVPANVCAVVPLIVVVPELCVKVPLLL